MKMYLYEGLNKQDRKTVMLWESAGRAINEAQLTADQITQLFQQIEQGATAIGGNRTALGLTKDAGSAVMKAYADLKSKVANSGPIKNIDAMYDQAAEKLKQATGGDQGVMQYVQRYRTFAKAHPIAQSLIYGALISAAGISGAGLGGAAALGLFKMVDKLLQGEKFSSAAWSGAKTGAMAYGASKIGDYMKGHKAPPGTDQLAAEWAKNQKDIAKDLLKYYSPENFDYTTNGMDINIIDKATGQVMRMVDLTNSEIGPIDPETFLTKILSGEYGKPVSAAVADAARAARDAAFDAAHPNFESRQLSAKQVTAIFERVVRLNSRMLTEGRLEEGIWDDVKSGAKKGLQGIKSVASKAAGAVGQQIKKGAVAGMQKAQQVGHNLTTKVTADKLQAAWKKAGSPTDSAEIEKVLQSAGVNPQVISTVFKTNNIPVSPATTAAQDMPAVMTPNRGQPATDAPAADASATGTETPNAQPQGGAQPTPGATSGTGSQPQGGNQPPAGGATGGQQGPGNYQQDGPGMINKPSDNQQPAPGQPTTNAPAQPGANAPAQPTASRLPDISKLTPAQKKELLKQVNARLRQMPAEKKPATKKPAEKNPFGYNTQTGQPYKSQADHETGEKANDEAVAAQKARYQAWLEKHPEIATATATPDTTVAPVAPTQPATPAPDASAAPTQPATAKPAKAKPEPIMVGGKKIDQSDPKFASLIKQLQQAKANQEEPKA